MASKYDSGSIIEFILEKNDSQINRCNSNGFVPLYIACVLGNDNAVTSLLKFADKINVFFKTEKDGNTIFMAACQGGNKKIIDLLTSFISQQYKGKDTKIELSHLLYRKNVNGDTPTHFACYYDSCKIIPTLANLYNEKSWQKKNKLQQTPLQVAQINKNKKTIKQLDLIETFIENR